jgi:YVTN family beta-propeller protein
MAPSVAIAADGRRAYVTNATSDDDHLLVVDTASNAIVKDQFLPIHPVGVAVSPDGTRVFVVGCKLSCIDGTLLTLDAATATVTSTIALAAAPSGLALAPDGTRAYVANGRDASVAIVTLATGGVAMIPVSPQPLGIAVEPSGRFLYVASYGTSRLDVVDTRTQSVSGHVNVSMQPRAIAITPDGRFAYVTHSQSACSVIDLGRVTGP